MIARLVGWLFNLFVGIMCIVYVVVAVVTYVAALLGMIIYGHATGGW